MRSMRPMVFASLLLCCLSMPVFADECQIASVFFGKVQLEPLQGGRSAIIKGADFDSKRFQYDAILGEITESRQGFDVHDTRQVVGAISPDMKIQGNNESCSRDPAQIYRVKAGVYVITVGSTIVGTIEGKFPTNSFGIR